MGRSIECQRFSTWKRRMWIGIDGWQIDDFEMLSSGSVTSWGGWNSLQRCIRLWSGLWSLLSASVGQRCTCTVTFPMYRRIVRGAIGARKASWRVVLMKHSRVAFSRNLHHFMPRKLNTQLLLFSELSPSFLDQMLCFLHCGTRKPCFGHCGHVQG